MENNNGETALSMTGDWMDANPTNTGPIRALLREHGAL